MCVILYELSQIEDEISSLKNEIFLTKSFECDSIIKVALEERGEKYQRESC